MARVLVYYTLLDVKLYVLCLWNLENVGECCKAQGVWVHQRIALYKSYLLLLTYKHKALPNDHTEHHMPFLFPKAWHHSAPLAAADVVTDLSWDIGPKWTGQNHLFKGTATLFSLPTTEDPILQEEPSRVLLHQRPRGAFHGVGAVSYTHLTLPTRSTV